MPGWILSTCGLSPGMVSTSNAFLRWLPATKVPTTIPPHALLHSLSTTQQNITPDVQTFSRCPAARGCRRYGRDWQVLPHQCDPAAIHGPRYLKVTAPTGIVAANICRSPIFSLLSLLSHTLTFASRWRWRGPVSPLILSTIPCPSKCPSLPLPPPESYCPEPTSPVTTEVA